MWADSGPSVPVGVHVEESQGQLGWSHSCVLENIEGQNHECVESWDTPARKLLGVMDCPI